MPATVKQAMKQATKKQTHHHVGVLPSISRRSCRRSRQSCGCSPLARFGGAASRRRAALPAGSGNFGGRGGHRAILQLAAAGGYSRQAGSALLRRLSFDAAERRRLVVGHAGIRIAQPSQVGGARRCSDSRAANNHGRGPWPRETGRCAGRGCCRTRSRPPGEPAGEALTEAVAHDNVAPASPSRVALTFHWIFAFSHALDSWVRAPSPRWPRW